MVVRRILGAAACALTALAVSCTNPFFERVKTAVDAAKGPRMSVTAAGAAVGDGGSFDMGRSGIATGISVDFTLSNTGHSDLVLASGAASITVGGADASMFTVSRLPAAYTISPGGSQTFTLTFIPVTYGLKSASLSIAAGSAPFTFTLTGTGAQDTPTFFPLPGTYNTDQSVSISCATTPDAIYYTTDGTTPTASSSVYAGPISAAGNGTQMTVKAYAVKSGVPDSAVASASYSIDYSAVAASAPVFTPAGGPFHAPGSVTITAPSAGSMISYTTDGSIPTTTNGTQAASPVSVPLTATTHLKAIAFGGGWMASSMTYIPYTFVAADPSFGRPAGHVGFTTTITISTITPGATIVYTTNGSVPSHSGAAITNGFDYSVTGPFTLPYGTSTVMATAFMTGYSDSFSVTCTYDNPLFLYSADQGGDRVSIFKIDPVGGSLSFQSSVMTQPGPNGLAVDALGRWLYTADSGPGSVTLYDITSTAPWLLEDTGKPSGGSLPGPMVIRPVGPTGNTLYVADTSAAQIDSFSMDPADGRLNALGSAPLPGAATVSLAADRQGRFVYASPLLQAFVDSYLLHADGTLSTIPGSPFFCGFSQAGAAVDPQDGKYLYISVVTGSIYGYSINAGTGALTSVAGSPFSGSGTGGPVAMDPQSRYLYVCDTGADKVYGFSIAPATGVLTALPTPFVTTGDQPKGIAVDPTGHFLYVAEYGANTVSSYAIAQVDGTLSLVGSYGTGGSGPANIVITGMAQ
jgi:6-phosphogluconolactonase (cycloisomerase 2 family)